MAFVVRKPGDAVADIPSGKSVVLYGPPLVGKTSTLQNDPTFRICLIDFDKNSGVVEESENVTIIGCDTFD